MTWTDDMAAEGWQRVWKITEVDGTTTVGYRWPLPMPDEPPVLVEATDIDRTNTGACPSQPGDGLCVVRTGIVRHVTSGGVRLACSIGLDIRIRPEWILGSQADEKLRVERCEVLGLFRPLGVIRAGAVNDLADANLAGADLTRAYLARAYLARAYLPWANLTGANLAGAALPWANLAGADLTGANLTRANLTWANLAGADLTRADLTGANLTRANLTWANLAGADLAGANLAGANLAGANLAGANLAGANLAGANLTGAQASAETVWPSGFDAAKAGVR